MIRVSRFRWSLLMRGMSTSRGDVACFRGLGKGGRKKEKQEVGKERMCVYEQSWKECQDLTRNRTRPNFAL